MLLNQKRRGLLVGRREIAHSRANKGTIPSKNYLNDRARTVERLIREFRESLGPKRDEIEKNVQKF